MATFRTGNHWGVTIVREGERTPEGHIVGADELVAVVVNGGTDLAERIATLLNVGVTSDVTFARGAAEALAEVRRRVDVAAGPGEQLFVETIHVILGAAAAALGIDESSEVRPSPASHSHVPADSCTCVYRPGGGADPNCIVHQGRRAKGPKPPNPPGCICDGSGRTCPRHGAVT